MNSLPPITIIRPLYRPLGVYRFPSGYPRYFIEVNGVVRWYRGGDMTGLSFLRDIYPDPNHWRQLFPRRVRSGIDVHAAAGWFVAACEKAGPYEPPDDLKPRSVGRLKRPA